MILCFFVYYDLDNISDDDTLKLGIATGVSLVYELDSDPKAMEHSFLNIPDA